MISGSGVHQRLSRTVTAVEKLERAHGIWFNWYEAHDGSVLTSWPGTGAIVRPFLSTVDNAWLVTGLKIAADADPELRPRVTRLLADADWSYYYTPYDPADPVAGPGQHPRGRLPLPGASTPRQGALQHLRGAGSDRDPARDPGWEIGTRAGKQGGNLGRKVAWRATWCV